MAHSTQVITAINREISRNDTWLVVIILAIHDLGHAKLSDIYNHKYVVTKLKYSNNNTYEATVRCTILKNQTYIQQNQQSKKWSLIGGWKNILKALSQSNPNLYYILKLNLII
jgi:hypothetical protein